MRNTKWQPQIINLKLIFYNTTCVRGPEMYFETAAHKNCLHHKGFAFVLCFSM